MWWWPAGQAGAGSGLDCPCPRGGLKAFFKSEVGVRAFFGAKSLLAKDTSPRCSGSLELDLTQPQYLHRLCPGKMAKPRSRRKTQQLPKLLTVAGVGTAELFSFIKRRKEKWQKTDGSSRLLNPLPGLFSPRSYERTGEGRHREEEATLNVVYIIKMISSQ